VEWDALVSADNGLPRATLLAGVLPESLLSVRSSGVTIEDEFAGRLEERWAVRRKAPLPVAPLVLGAIAAWEGEPVEHRGYRRKRDQRLKRAALDAAKGSCAVCATDYSNVLDGKGVRVLQVHHKKQLGQNDAPRLNTINDLAVVCANCHALIHMNAKKALTIEVLKSLLKEAR
jgi:predicted HNH restriction endonuclease